MSTDSRDFQEILERFDKLSSAERDELLDTLERQQRQAANGESPPISLSQAFQKRGMVGSIGNAPADWSSNLKHLESFG